MISGVVFTALFVVGASPAGETVAPAATRSQGTCASLPIGGRTRMMVAHDTMSRLRKIGVAESIRAATSLEGAIPIAFHVIHDGELGKISLETIQTQIEVLNQAYHPGRFELVELDYTDNADWFRMSILSRAERQAKAALQKDRHLYLNFYTCEPPEIILGWAYQPFLADFFPVMDGVVVRHSTLPGGTEYPYDEGDTAVHEVGHWAGLFHTFTGPCFSQGDLIADTPQQLRASRDCEIGRDTCPFHPGLDPIHNYMDYSDDACSDHFTLGQFSYMSSTLLTRRPQIWDQLLYAAPRAAEK
jgi:hypothetical protein